MASLSQSEHRCSSQPVTNPLVHIFKGNVSDIVADRDNFFHSCWMKLKHERADLNDDLTRIELETAGYNIKDNENDSGEDSDRVVTL